MQEGNGLAKKRQRTIVTMKNSLLLDSGFPLDFWVEVIDIINYLQNRLPTKIQKREFILQKAQTSQMQDISHIRVFEIIVYIKIFKEKQYK